MKHLKTFDEITESYNKPRAGGKKRWSVKYKKTINCSNPKGFSQKQYCKRKRKGGAYKNESAKWWEKVVDKDEVKSIAESYLAYLMDEGFQVGINLDRHEDDPTTDLHLFKEATSFSEVDPYGDDDVYDLFEWSDVKEHFIPFIKMFMREYTFSTLKLYAFYGNNIRLFRLNTGTFEDLIEGKFEVPEELREIVISNISKI